MTTPTQGEHAQTEALAHAAGLESFSESLPAYGFNPQPLKDAAATIRRLHSQVAALTAQPVAQTDWHAPVRELLGHISDVISDDEFDQIDTAKWNAVSALVGATTPAQPAAPTPAAQADSVLEEAAQVEIDLFNDLNRTCGNTLTAYAKELCRLGYRKTDAARKQGGKHD